MNLLDKLLIRRSVATKAKSLEKERHEGHKAAELLRDGIFTQVVEGMRKNLIENLTACPIHETENAERMRFMIKCLDAVVKDIEDAYITGQMAEKQLQENAEKKKKK